VQNSYGAEFPKELNSEKIDKVFLKGTEDTDDVFQRLRQPMKILLTF
jgi:hypothetical protein